MEQLILRIASSAVEAVIAGGALAFVRKIQMAFGVKDDTSNDTRTPTSHAS